MGSVGTMGQLPVRYYEEEVGRVVGPQGSLV